MDHDGPNWRVEGVPEKGYQEEEGEQEDVEDEEDDREVVQPGGLEGYGGEEDGDDACAHGYGEPAFWQGQ